MSKNKKLEENLKQDLNNILDNVRKLENKILSITKEMNYIKTKPKKNNFKKIVAHIVVKTEDAYNDLNNICNRHNNDMYIDFEQSFDSYIKERK